MIRGFLLIVVLVMSGVVHSQDKTRYLSASAQIGSVIVHSRDVRAIKDSYPFGFELDFGTHKTSEKVWNSCSCYPRSGFSLTFWDFDNKSVLGYGLTGMYYLQPVFRADKKFSFSIRGGFGLSYQSNPHDPESNPDNLSYSTYVAFPLELGLGFHYKISDLWQVETRIMYNHISNGGLQQPNKGINWPTLGIAVSRYLQPMSFPDREKTDWRLDGKEKSRLEVSAFITYQEPEQDFYLVSPGIEVKYAQRVARISNLSAGIEWMYDTNQAKLSADQGDEEGNHLGIAVGHEFILGKFLFAQQFGVYFLKSPSRPEDVYQRYSLVRRLGDHFSVGASLKAHGHVADFLDLRIGYAF